MVESSDAHEAERDELTGCGCDASCEAADGAVTRRVLPVVWQRLVTDGETCPRCGSTENEVKRAVSTLAKVLAPLGIAPTLETKALDRTEFEAAPSESNRIFIADRPLESWLGATVSASQCCSVCGDDRCRTVEIDGTTFETIPERLIVKAGLLAAATLVDA